MMTGFTGSLLLELYDPVWIFIDRRLLLGFFVFLLVQFLYTRSIKSQIICTVVGTLQGEIVYSIILKKWEFPYTIGSWDYLDVCAIFLLLIMLWALINYVLSNISLKNSVEKEKQG